MHVGRLQPASYTVTGIRPPKSSSTGVGEGFKLEMESPKSKSLHELGVTR